MNWPRGLLLDTHAAIWLVEGSLDTLALDVIIHAGLADGVFISPVTAWEVGLLARTDADGFARYLFRPDPQTWFANLINQTMMKAQPLTNTAAIAASHLPGTFHKDPADRFLVATAREMDVALMTRDEKILDYGRQGHVRTWEC